MYLQMKKSYDFDKIGPKINFDKLIDNTNTFVKNIFEIVKQHNWTKLIQFIKNLPSNSNVDLNIQDESNTWLIEYAILFNQLELINILLERNIRIDVTDNDSRSILYNVIKFSYFEILEKILEKDQNIIGKTILEIKDNDQNIPLFYAIKFFNYKCVNLILKYTTNFNIRNIDGDNLLHLTIKTQNFDMFKLVSEYFKDIKSRNKYGESYLHLIIKYKCYDMLEYFILHYHNKNNFNELLNYTDYKYNFTILHYICISLDLQSLQIFAKYNVVQNIDGNIQDNSGNIFYHYFINNIIGIKKLTQQIITDIFGLNDIFKTINFDINLFNIDGNTPAHIFFDNIKFFSSNGLYMLINWMTESINMNIQNFNGLSIFYLIVKNNYWKDIANILITKKLDIFILSNGISIFDYIEKKDYEIFLTMITNSYLYQLENFNKSNNFNKSDKWIEYWDNRCKKIIKYAELNETELEIIKNLEIKITNSNVCFDIIRNKLDKSIDVFIKTKNSYDFTSFPISYKFTKLISKYPIVIISTYSGSTLDILSGLIYLKNKFNETNEKNYLNTSMNIIKNKNNIIDCVIRSNGIKICEISEFEILWINKNIIYPKYKSNSIQSDIKNIIQTKLTNWYIIPIGIEIGSLAHANYLIFDIINFQVERFEPHGLDNPNGMNYEPEQLDRIIYEFIKNINDKFIYLKPSDYLPKIGFQTKEINELQNDYIGDPNGFCALWCVWWADMRLSNPNIHPKKLVKQLNKELINSQSSYKKLIRDYSWYIIDVRDKLLTKSDTNINEWINDTLDEKNIELLDNNIKEAINKL